jgi:alginate O-acetyltransferase complex protein AlgJ
VFDPSEALASARQSGRQYLATDTHWRPEAMEGVAELLAGFIATHVSLPVRADPRYRIERPEVRNTGDLARMLGLPDDQPLFPPETVWLRRVLQPDGSPWRPSRDADVLLLGDSFSNIYSLESMGWGTSAGLVEQLSYALRRPIDRLVQNDEGAFATRAMLQRDPARLAGKRVVVYQFAARELAGGDWKVIRAPAAEAGNVADVRRVVAASPGALRYTSFTSCLPTFSPWSMPTNARGAFSNPCSMRSR